MARRPTPAVPELKLALAFRASPASRKKLTMPSSAAVCWPTSDGVMRSPSAAMVLLAPDIEEADSKEGLLWRHTEMSMK